MHHEFENYFLRKINEKGAFLEIILMTVTIVHQQTERKVDPKSCIYSK